VKQGEVLGIIGKNGAGKSTLLKILSRVTTPTTGIIKAKGRIAPLLEVGTGFHPELTGRENIYMNGSIMGMTKKEITGKLDEIVDFAGVARYLDTPTKRYSSGMTVRLGFSIAAHLEPEILVVDEVLAVGDAEFQKKAIGKMKDVSRGEGRTVLFVSHNMASIKALCKTGILLQKGSISYTGNIENTIGHYVDENYLENPKIRFKDLSSAPGNENIRIRLFEVSPVVGHELNVESGLQFRLQFYNYKPDIMLDATFELSTADDIVIFHSGKVLTPDKDSKKGMYEVCFQLPPYFLNAGKYKMKLIFGENQRYPLWAQESVLCFCVENTLTGQGYNMATPPGIIKPRIDFSHNYSLS
jgi:lipopolysaccharide transport system ATP-binding protein